MYNVKIFKRFSVTGLDDGTPMKDQWLVVEYVDLDKGPDTYELKVQSNEVLTLFFPTNAPRNFDVHNTTFATHTGISGFEVEKEGE